MAMSRLGLFVFFRPFEQSPVAPDLHRRQAVARSFQLPTELFVNAEQPRRLYRVAEETVDHDDYLRGMAGEDFAHEADAAGAIADAHDGACKIKLTAVIARPFVPFKPEPQIA